MKNEMLKKKLFTLVTCFIDGDDSGSVYGVTTTTVVTEQRWT